MNLFFGASLTEPLANVVVRSWVFFAFLMGALLIYGAFRPESRMLCIVTAGLSKVDFYCALRCLARNYADALRMTVIFDTAVVAVLAVYVIASKHAAVKARESALEKSWALGRSTLGKAPRSAQRSNKRRVRFFPRAGCRRRRQVFDDG